MNEPYVNQYIDLYKTSLMQLMWENGPTTALEGLMAGSHALALRKIEEFLHLGNGNPYHGHVYRATEVVSSSGFYDEPSRFEGMHVTHRVNLDETRDNAGMGTKYLHNGLIDDGQARPFEWFSRVAEFFIPDWQSDPACAIHVNCAAGASRAPSMAYFLVRATSGLGILDSKATVYAANSVIGRNISLTYWQSAEVALARLGLVKPIEAKVFEHLPVHVI